MQSNSKLTVSAEAAAASPIRGSRAWLVLGALAAGLVAGLAAGALPDESSAPLSSVAAVVGGMWLDALRMTVIPLIVALLVTGVAKGAEAARAGRIAGRSILWFVIICTASAVFGAIMMPLLLSAIPLPAAAAEALRTSLAAIDPGAAEPPLPAAADFLRAIIPANVIAAASNGDVLPLVVFTLLFAIALTRIGEAQRRSVAAFFEGIADALLVVISWVLWLAPVGVFALAFVVGAGAGGAAFTGLLHYIILVSALGLLVTIAGYAIATFAGGVPIAAFAKAMIAPQAVAISTQSSLASLPAMLASARILGLRERVADITLPLAVALFRATGPAMNIGVALYIAHWFGIEIGATELIAGTAVAAVMSYAAVSLPGTITFFTSIAPIAMAMGVPIAPLALLVAVETIPDIFRTVGNVTLDVAVTSAVDRGTSDERVSPES
ncbi:MAG TPA: cation:dicarboxylase symporter family transporter [Sphingomicrobium sp.]|nr:cation:dicarboxylase symporter family transporter [Sphingomicrobium sp.]